MSYQRLSPYARRLLLFPLISLLALALPTKSGVRADGTELTQQKIVFQKKAYSYLVFAPNGRDHSRDLPALLLLHGAGGRGNDMISAWTDFARNNEILLIAPDLPRDPAFEPIAPAFFKELVEAVSKEWAIDSRRVYVFGHSMGGYLAFDAAMFDSGYFAAAAVHASFIAPDYVGIIEHAARKIPVALYIGTEDRLVHLDDVRRTKALLLANGFPLRYQELKNHDHDYFAISKTINSDVWAFFRQHRLN